MTLELDDIQGIVLQGYGKLTSACFVLLSIEDAQAAKRFLGELALRPATDSSTAPSINVAFTSEGLAKLGLDRQTLATFPSEFVQGMVTEFRKRVLGDVEQSDPIRWDWGGPEQPPVHLLLMLYAASPPELVELLGRLRDEWTKSGLSEQRTLDTEWLPDNKEHFGFRDGISEVTIRGHQRRESGVAPGEFLLGYPNEYEKFTLSPTVPESPAAASHLARAAAGRDLGRNGSFMVFRQLEQHVRAFWKWIDAQAEGRPEERLRIAAKMVGRWPNGASLVKYPHAEPSNDANFEPDTEFQYVRDGDELGHRCPLGAHIRRTNPRDVLTGEPGDERLANLHKLVRRGRAYGKPLAADMKPESILSTMADDAGRGLHFICFNANIERQFEFVQQTWSNNAKFAGLRNDPDPLTGARYHAGSQFTIQQAGVRRRYVGMPNFVTVRGGAYFFMPGLRAVKYLSAL